MVRRATLEDIPDLVDMGRKFHAQSKMLCGFDPVASAGILEGMINSDAATVIRSDSGGIGGILNPAYCDPSWVMAVELFWWADDRQGLKLINEFEKWAKSMNANEVRMTSLQAIPRSAEILDRRGYIRSEISHQKVI